MATISEICNNPLNIKSGKDNWQGKVGEHKGFVIFKNDVYGLRAAVKILLGYLGMGFITPEMIIRRWAPESENNVQSYIRAVEQLTGEKISRSVEIDSWPKLTSMIIAMSHVERGKEASWADLDRGILLALQSLSALQKKGKERVGWYVSDELKKK